MSLAQCAHAAGISKSYLTELEVGVKERMRPPKYAGLRTALQIQHDDRRLLTPTEDQHGKDSDGPHEGAPRPHPDTG